MTLKTMIPAAIVAAVMAAPAMAHDAGMENWLALPEDPSMAPYCVLDKKFSTALAKLKAKGATPTEMMRWGEIEAEKYAPGGPEASQNPEADPDGWLPLGVQGNIIELILAMETYSKSPPEGYPGFPAFAYRSCLKGKSIGAKHH